MILLLRVNLPETLITGQKKLVVWSINADNFVLRKYSVKSANYASSAFLGK